MFHLRLYIRLCEYCLNCPVKLSLRYFDVVMVVGDKKNLSSYRVYESAFLLSDYVGQNPEIIFIGLDTSFQKYSYYTKYGVSISYFTTAWKI